MSTATMDAIQDRFDNDEQQAAMAHVEAVRAYRLTVIALARDEPVDPDESIEIVRTADRTPGDLQSDVERLKRRLEASEQGRERVRNLYTDANSAADVHTKLIREFDGVKEQARKLAEDALQALRDASDRKHQAGVTADTARSELEAVLKETCSPADPEIERLQEQRREVGQKSASLHVEIHKLRNRISVAQTMDQRQSSVDTRAEIKLLTRELETLQRRAGPVDNAENELREELAELEKAETERLADPIVSFAW